MRLPAVWCPTGRIPWWFLVLWTDTCPFWVLQPCQVGVLCCPVGARAPALVLGVHRCVAAWPRGGFSQPWVNPARLFPKVTVPLQLSLQRGRGPCRRALPCCAAQWGLLAVVLTAEGLRASQMPAAPRDTSRESPRRASPARFPRVVGLSLRTAGTLPALGEEAQPRARLNHARRLSVGPPRLAWCVLGKSCFPASRSPSGSLMPATPVGCTIRVK